MQRLKNLFKIPFVTVKKILNTTSDKITKRGVFIIGTFCCYLTFKAGYYVAELQKPSRSGLLVSNLLGPVSIENITSSTYKENFEDILHVASFTESPKKDLLDSLTVRFIRSTNNTEVFAVEVCDSVRDTCVRAETNLTEDKEERDFLLDSNNN